MSTRGGTWPKWNDTELFYWEGNSLMAVACTTEGRFTAGTPRRLFTGGQVGMGADNMMTSYNPEYDVNAAGTRFVVTQRLERSWGFRISCQNRPAIPVLPLPHHQACGSAPGGSVS